METKMGGTRVSLHPLTIVAISDHFTGIQAGGSMKPPGSKVLGLLWGKQNGLEVTITDAVELIYSLSEAGEPVISPQEVAKQKELYQKVYPGHELLGWYSVGTEVSAGDTALHREMEKYNESPFFLLMHPSPDPEAKDLPLALYEAELHAVEDEMRMIFVAVNFSLETTQAERVTMEEVAKAKASAGVSAADVHMNSVSTSLRALSNRAITLEKYLVATTRGEIAPDQKLLRQVAAIASALPAADVNELDAAFMEDYNDTQMVEFLAAVTKSSAQLSDLAEKFTHLTPSRAQRF